MDPDQEPTYPHPHHCHLVNNPLVGSFRSSIIMTMPPPPLFDIDPTNPMQRTSIGHQAADAPPGLGSQAASPSSTSERVAMESAQRHDPQTQRRLDARDHDARMAKLAQDQFDMDRHTGGQAATAEDKGSPAQVFIRDVSILWGEAGSGEAQRHAAQVEAERGAGPERK